MANPYEKYVTKTEQTANPYGKYETPPEGAGNSIMESDFGQLPYGVLESIPSLPGAPVELAAWAKGIPVEKSNLENWGSKGWTDYFEKVTNSKLRGPAPTSEVGAKFRKLGNFLGGGAIGGPSGMVPALTSFAGSEGGKLLDDQGITNGYGEPVGALVGAFAPGIVSGQFGVPKGPTVEKLRELKNAAYRESEQKGGIFTPELMQRMHDTVAKAAAEFSYTPELQPGVAPVLRLLEEAKSSNITLEGIDQIRQVAGYAAKEFTKPSQQTLAGKIKEIIDEVVDTAQPHEVLAGQTGNAKEALRLIKSARNLNQRMRLAETIDEALYQAKNNAGSTGTGGNLENAMRQKIKAILNSPKRRASFTAAERKLMEKITRGSWTQNNLRMLGSFAPSRGVVPAALLAHLGLNAFGAGIPATVSLPVLGGYAAVTGGAKRMAESLTERNIARLNATVRMRGGKPLTAQEKAAALALEAKRRAMLAGGSAGRAVPGIASSRDERE